MQQFAYLDGIRGLAAFWVVMYHAFLFTGYTNETTSKLPIGNLLLGWGYLGVPVFIVLSGYVLMLPLLKTPSLEFNGTISYMRRRSRRILPPYIGVLVLSVALIVLIPPLQHPLGTQWDTKIPLTWSSLLAHALLIQDFSNSWAGNINGPLWSVAVEWHIYFIFPFILVPFWRRTTGYVVITATAACTFLIPIYFHLGLQAHPWFISLFSMGMLAAQITVRDKVRPWSLLISGICLALIFAICLALSGHDVGARGWASEMLTGVLIATILTFMGRHSQLGLTSWLSRLLGSKPLVFAGTISYSVYLLHSPLLALANIVLLRYDMPIGLRLSVMLLIIVPLDIFICWSFYMAIERRFRNHRQIVAAPRGQ